MPSSSSAAQTCAKCSQPLEIEIDTSPSENASDTSMNDEEDTHPQTVPDDVLLPCGDHFHWECLLQAYELSRCPHCDTDITSSPPSSTPTPTHPQILVDMTNEGGLQPQIDIFPLLQEETYLRAYPEDRKSRAFLEFCREGDHRAIADLLKSCNDKPSDDDKDEDEDEPSISPDSILRYQDPLNDQESGLHAAAANGHREVAWLLLLLASEYPELEIPALVFQEAATLGVMREDQTGKVDVRSLKDAHDRTAEDVARQAGVVWNGWIGNGRLAIP